MFGLMDQGILEVRCKSKWCGAKSGVIVLHRISLETGEVVKTLQFRDPKRAKES